MQRPVSEIKFTDKMFTYYDMWLLNIVKLLQFG